MGEREKATLGRAMKLVAILMVLGVGVAEIMIAIDRRMTDVPTGIYTTLHHVTVYDVGISDAYLIGHTRKDAQWYEFCWDWDPGFRRGTRLKDLIFENRERCKSLSTEKAGYNPEEN
jgi:hypothetical protein